MTNQEFSEQINNMVSNPDDFVIRYGRGGKDLSHRFSSYSKTDRAELSKAVYVIKFFSDKEIFIVWSNTQRREHRLMGAGGYIFDSGLEWTPGTFDKKAFVSHYKQLGGNRLGVWEKVYVVGLSNMQDFFEHCDTYMSFNEFDFEHVTDCPNSVREKAQWLTENERKQYSSLRKQRDINFRDSVLSAYGCRCAICRCAIIDLLQAAHERGYEAAKTNFDNPKHGICLCANHHLMYDRKLGLV